MFSVFFLIALLRSLNGGIALVFDYSGETWEWNVTSSYVPWFPGSSGDSGFYAFAGMTAVATCVLGCRHALGKAARAMFVFLSSFFAAIAAFSAVWTVFSSSHHTVPVFAGSAFGIFFLASIAALAGMFERRWNKALLLFSLSAGGTFVGLWCFASPFVFVFFCIAGGVLFLVSGVNVVATRGLSQFFKFFVSLVIAASIPLAMAKISATAEIFESKMSLFSFDLFSADFWAVRQKYVNAASEVWRAGNIWHGAGMGYLPLYIKKTMVESAWVSCIPHGWWQLLAERGFIGLGMFALPFTVLLFLLVRRLIAYGVKNVFWPFLVLGVLTVSVVICEGFYDISFMRTEVLIPAASLFTLSVSSIPPKRSEKDNNQ